MSDTILAKQVKDITPYFYSMMTKLHEMYTAIEKRPGRRARQQKFFPAVGGKGDGKFDSQIPGSRAFNKGSVPFSVIEGPSTFLFLAYARNFPCVYGSHNEVVLNTLKRACTVNETSKKSPCVGASTAYHLKQWSVAQPSVSSMDGKSQP